MPSFKNGHCSIFTLLSLSIFKTYLSGIFGYGVAHIFTNHKTFPCININKSNCNLKDVYTQHFVLLAILCMVGEEEKYKTNQKKNPHLF